jgi:transcriptional regulator with XRE-family HTH domain
MNDAERMICARLRQVRESINWSRSALSRHLGITYGTLVSIEHARTPLRYDIAWSIQQTLGVSLRWLFYGLGDADDFENDMLPPPEHTGLSPRALLTAVIAKWPHAGSGYSKLAIQRAVHNADDLIKGCEAEGKIDVVHREYSEQTLRTLVRAWVAEVPLGRLGEFSAKIIQAAEDLIKTFPPEPFGTADRRADEIMWERLRVAIAKKNISTTKNLSSVLTDFTPKSKRVVVHSELGDLLTRLHRATAASGMKGRLARTLGVPQSRVSEWLHGEKKPGGEVTLRLLKWVEQQERILKQKSPESATNTTGDTSTLRKGKLSETFQSKSRRQP